MRMTMLLVLVAAVPAIPASAITLGQTATFQAGLEGWSSALSNFSRIDDGGPSGAGDAYLSATSRSPSFVLSVLNRNSDAWGGDYIGAGVTAVECDLINLGQSDLQIRFFFYPDQSSSVFMSSAAFSLPADGLWHQAQFGVSIGDITPDALQALQNVGVIGFVHQVDFPGDAGTPVVGSLGIDNVLVVPESSSVTLLLGLGGLLLLGR